MGVRRVGTVGEDGRIVRRDALSSARSMTELKKSVDGNKHNKTIESLHHVTDPQTTLLARPDPPLLLISFHLLSHKQVGSAVIRFIPRYIAGPKARQKRSAHSSDESTSSLNTGPTKEVHLEGGEDDDAEEEWAEVVVPEFVEVPEAVEVDKVKESEQGPRDPAGDETKSSNEWVELDDDSSIILKSWFRR